MCFYSKLSKKAVELENRFKAKMDNASLFVPCETINAFTFPATPVITDKDPDMIHLYQWGLIPFWAKDKSIRKHTLNARIETLNEKPAFRAASQQRCLVISDGFYEWQWLDAAGKQKQKFQLSLPDGGLFAFAGIYSQWTDTESGELLHTYSIVTTEAIGLMSVIHNSKHRMPVILEPALENDWLQGAPLPLFERQTVPLKAEQV